MLIENSGMLAGVLEGTLQDVLRLRHFGKNRQFVIQSTMQRTAFSSQQVSVKGLIGS